jgi:hypothetical protein
VERRAAEDTAHVSENALLYKMIERVSTGEASRRVGTWHTYRRDLLASTDPGGLPTSRCLLCIWVLDEQVADPGLSEQVARMGGIGFQFAAQPGDVHA